MAKKRKDKTQTQSVDATIDAPDELENNGMENQIVEDEFEAIEEREGENGQETLAALQEALQAANAKAEEYLDGWQRARAEFSNYKKRVDRDQAQIKQTVSGNILKRYLEVVDDLERALRNRPQEGDGAAWANGIELIYRKLLAILESEGVTQMQAEGQIFDPNVHEAITSEASDNHESGEIIEVVQHGYFIGERVLRPAMVRVAM